MKLTWIARFALVIPVAFTYSAGHSNFSAHADTTSPQSSLHSQKREPGESYIVAMKRYVDEVSRISPPPKNAARSAIDSAVHYEFLNFSHLTRWDGGLPTIYKGFESSRDERFLFTKNQAGFARRIPWLYPDDGCYARSAMQGKELARNGFIRPSKIFIFGDLELRTPNHPDRVVTWWYHQANAVYDGKTVWILDPATEAKKPIQLIEWLTSVTRRPDTTFIAICSPYTYAPSHVCFNAAPATEQPAEADIVEYLDEEWSRLKDLKRKPESELGDNPPWKN